MLEIPAIEKFYNPILFAEISDNPVTQRAVEIHSRHAASICQYLVHPSRSSLESYFKSLAVLLSLPDNARLALYLPLEELQDAPTSFRISYLNAWRRCLEYEDVRENFNLGDSLEIAARDEDFPYVVKAAHLVPWLLKYKYLSESEILDLLEEGSETLIRSICDCEKMFYNIRFVTSPEFQLKISKLARSLPKRESRPLFNSEERQKWLQGLEREEWGKITPHNIAGPFSANFHEWMLPQPHNDEIILIGGSFLKGYSATSSDIDRYFYNPEQKQVTVFCKELKDCCVIPNQNIAHICLDTVWLSRRIELKDIQHHCIEQYLKLAPNSVERRQSLERLEQDLVQYRLMHKGIKRIYGNISEHTKYFPEIDGTSAFYDRRYRRIASQIYAKYVFLPQI